jgi:hypothetical protein
MKQSQPLIIVDTNLRVDLVACVIKEMVIERIRPSAILGPTKNKGGIITEEVQPSMC